MSEKQINFYDVHKNQVAPSKSSMSEHDNEVENKDLFDPKDEDSTDINMKINKTVTPFPNIDNNKEMEMFD